MYENGLQNLEDKNIFKNLLQFGKSVKNPN